MSEELNIYFGTVLDIPRATPDQVMEGIMWSTGSKTQKAQIFSLCLKRGRRVLYTDQVFCLGT